MVVASFTCMINIDSSAPQVSHRKMNNRFSLFITILLLTSNEVFSSSAPSSSPSSPAPPFPWFDPSLPLSTRLSTLLQAMTIQEKITFMQDNPPSIPRLLIPSYSYYSQCGHGVADVNGIATIFPIPLAQAATFHPSLIYNIGRVLANESRAYYNTYSQSHNNNTIQYFALSELLPVGNLFTHSYWGRGQESYGEDPILSSILITSLIHSLQHRDTGGYIQVGATCKHMGPYALDGDIPVGGHDNELRTHYYANLSMADIEQTYMAPFTACAKANVEGMMVAYLDLNGAPVTVSPLLHYYTQAWNYSGYLIADGSRLLQCMTNYHYTDNLTTLAVIGVKRGIDLEIDTVYQDNLLNALQMGLLNESDIDASLVRTLSTRFRLGLFDPPSMVSYSTIDLSIIDLPSSRALAYEAAVESMVLLKNDGGFLPIDYLSPSLHTIAIVGPNANRTSVLLGNYEGCTINNGQVNPSCNLITPLVGIIRLIGRINKERALRDITAITVTYDYAVDTNSNNRSGIQPALDHVNAADLCIAIMGLDISIGQMQN